MADATWTTADKITTRGDTMNTDIWYDLAIRELSDLTDPGKEKLAEAAAETLADPEVVETEDKPAEPAGPRARESEAPHRG